MGLRRSYAGLREFELIVIATPGDGSCLFHAVCHALYPSYLAESVANTPMTRRDIVSQLRRELAAELQAPNPNDALGRSYYDSIANGEVAVLGRSMPQEFSLQHLQGILRSDEWAPEVIVVYLGQRLQKTLYLIDSSSDDLYVTAGLPDPQLPAILLYYTRDSHYDLMGLRDSDNRIVTHFAAEHPLVQALYRRLVRLKGRLALGSAHKA